MTTYTERTKPTASYSEDESPSSEYVIDPELNSEYSSRGLVTASYNDRDVVTGESKERLRCGTRYRWQELVEVWKFYHVSWDFLNGSPCTNYAPRTTVL